MADRSPRASGTATFLAEAPQKARLVEQIQECRGSLGDEDHRPGMIPSARRRAAKASSEIRFGVPKRDVLLL
jgi:hypothetical protein